MGKILRNKIRVTQIIRKKCECKLTRGNSPSKGGFKEDCCKTGAFFCGVGPSSSPGLEEARDDGRFTCIFEGPAITGPEKKP